MYLDSKGNINLKSRYNVLGVVDCTADKFYGDGSNLTNLPWTADPMTTRGDIIYRNASNATARFALGTIGQVISSDGTDLVWSSAGAGDVTGPSSAVDENIVVFDSTTGKLIKDSGINKTAITANSAKISYTDAADVALNTTHRGLTNDPHNVTKDQVGLSNVPNTDCTNASNITTGTISSSILPPVALTTVQVAVNEAAQLALTAEEGDVCVRSDLNKSYMHNSGSTGTMSDWTELQTPTDSVLSVNGEVGSVVLTTGDIAEDANYRFITDAQETNLNNQSGINTGDQSAGDFNHDDLNNVHQDVTIASSPTLNGINFTNISADDVNITDINGEFNSSEVESALNELVVKTDVNGYDRYDTNSLPEVTISNRTISVAVRSGQSSFHFWTNNKKITKTTTQSVTVPDVTGSYYIYFDDLGVLQYILQSSVTSIAFYKYAITAFVYWNASNSTSLFNPDELHGKDMSGITHESMHMTTGARYSMGLDIEGLTDADEYYTQSTSGLIYDEDIQHLLPANAVGHKMLYRYGTDGAWRVTAADLKVAHTEGGTYHTWNEWTGTTWQWTEGTSQTDYWITFFLATPTGIMKMAGQNAYSSRSNARAAIETEVENINTNGLPNPEMVWLGAVICRRNGDLENMADGSVFYNLKQIKGGGGTSNGTSYASDIPTDITNFNTHLSATDVNVQLALETLDDHTHTASQVTDFDVEVGNNSYVVANTAKVSYNSTDSTKVGFISVTQAVDLDTMEDDIGTNNAKVSYPGSANATELNILDGATITTAELNTLDGFTGDKDDLNYAKDLRATGVTTTEFDYLDGVTSSIQTQLNAKGDMDDVVDDTTPQLGGDLDWNSNGCQLASQTVGGSNGNAVYLSGSNTWTAADASAESTCSDQLGIRISATNVLTHGVYTTSGLTAGAIYYVSETTGAITATQPTTATSIVRVIGYALSTTELFVDPDKTWVEIGA